ncbi:MAG: hypothetical protein ACP5QP_07160 [Brevinematia bacterium]
MKLYKILIILVAVLLVPVAFFAGCSSAPTEGGTGGGTGGSTGGTTSDRITIIFDFSGTYLPENYSVVPFVVGGLNSINSNKFYSWDQVTNGGINQDGTGTQVLTKIDASHWKLEILDVDNLLDPSTPVEVQFKAANYNPAGWIDVTTNFWGTIGAQTTGLDNEKIVISNKQIIEAYKPGDTNAVLPGQSTNGITVSADGKTITINVGAHGGWSLHIAYSVSNVSVTFAVSNVATNKGTDALVGYGYTGTFNGWSSIEPATILSTNGDGTVNIIGTITYTGVGKIEYKVRASNATSGSWEWASGGNIFFAIPSTATTYTNYAGPVSF